MIPLVPLYHLSWTNPNERLYDVTLRFSAPADNPRLLLPAWRPGRYLRQDYAANVREWSAGMVKEGLHAWRVEASAGEEVEVRYRYYAGVLDAGSSFLDPDEAYWNGSNLFLLVEGVRGEACRLTVEVAPDWQVEIQLPRGEDGSFVARDYDHLIDSPGVASARMTTQEFAQGVAGFRLVFRGDEGINTEQYVEPMAAIARSQAGLFGGLPFTNYRFLFHVGDRWHGVEHEDSCSIILRRQALLGTGPGDEGYDHVLSISSHELFHAWNVKRMMPAVFLPYDYWRETPTRLLWVMEGVTSYYGELTLVRAGLWDEARYLKHLEDEIQTLESSTARHHLSLAQASFDGWLATPAHMHDLANAFYSFYNKGELVAMLLDLTIRERSGGTKSLDDVMRLLWAEYGLGKRGMEEDAFERAVARVADVGDFFARYVEGTEPLPYTELLDRAGLALTLEPRDGDHPGLGAKLKVTDGLLVVDTVYRGGSAMASGLLPGDELLAIDGTRTTTESVVGSALRGVRPGGRAELLVSRAGVIRRHELTMRRDPRVNATLRVNGESGLRREWLRRDE
jgi:predicted metalloprotease with PDZ domain